MNAQNTEDRLARFVCPKCDQPIECSASTAADGIVCPSCNTEFVPEISAALEPPPAIRAQDKPKRSKSVLGDVCMAFAGLFSLVACGAVLAGLIGSWEAGMIHEDYNWVGTGMVIIGSLLCAGFAAAVGQLAYIRRLLETRTCWTRSSFD